MTEILIIARGGRGRRCVLIAILFKALWKVPSADEALIVTGFGVKGAPARRADIELGPDGQPTAQAAAASKTFKIVTGGGKFVIPVLQKAQYLSLRADSAELEVTGVDKQKIPVGVKGVAIFKVGDDDQSITNAATRFLDEGDGQASQMHHARQGGLPRPPALDHRRAVGRGPDRQPQRARAGDARRLRAGDAEARARRRLAADPGHHRSLGLHRRARRAAHGRGQDAGPHRPGRRRPRGDRARAGGRGAEGRRPARHRAEAGRLPGRARPRDGDDRPGRPAGRRRGAQAGRRAGDRGRRPRGPARGEAARDDGQEAGRR